jgi:5-methyltetrahydropteroyltriglutamate--homocysteine methyltransferase
MAGQADGDTVADRPVALSLPILPTTLVGSWPQPSWLIDRERLDRHLPMRVRANDLWRVGEEHLAEAQRDGIALAVHEQERVGLDIITDGEVRRESYSNRFATSLDGIDVERPGEAVDRTGATVPVPRVVGPIRRRAPVEVDVVAELRRHTDRPLKVTLPGPFTMGQQAQDDFYRDDAELALAYAAAVNEEVLDLFAAGADIVQLDEPYVQARPDAARRHAVAAIDRALRGARGTTVLHVCFGYGRHVADKPTGYDFLPELGACRVDEISIEAAQPRLDLGVLDDLSTKRVHVGVLDLRDTAIEPAEVIVRRIRAALEHLPPERLVIAPDCGCKYLPRDVAWGKAAAMVAAARRVRHEIS